MAGGYDGARVSSRRDSASTRGARSVDEDNQIGKWDRDTLRRECLDLFRNTPIGAACVRRFSDNVVGTGIRPQARTSSPEWNKAAEAFWAEWSKVADYRKRVSLRDFQRLVITNDLMLGETFFVLTSGGQIQPIEPDREKNPGQAVEGRRMVEGFELANGIPVAYWFGDRDEFGNVVEATTRRRREDVIHCIDPVRIDQVRGIPKLAPVITALKDYGQLTADVLTRANIEARRGIVVKSKQGAAKISTLGPRNVTPNSTERQARVEEIAGHQVAYLGEDEDFSLVAPVTPSGVYPEYNRLLLQLFGAAVGLPWQFLLLHFDSNMSSSIAGLAQAYRTLQLRHAWLCEVFNSRLWNWRIAKAINDGDLSPAPVDSRGVSEWYKVEWSQPDFSWINPHRQTQAMVDQFNMGLTSITREAATLGLDGEEIMAQKAGDIATAQRLANEANAINPELRLTWRDLINTLMPGQTAPIVAGQDGSTQGTST